MKQGELTVYSPYNLYLLIQLRVKDSKSDHLPNVSFGYHDYFPYKYPDEQAHRHMNGQIAWVGCGKIRFLNFVFMLLCGEQHV